jgi:hypothetical protein
MGIEGEMQLNQVQCESTLVVRPSPEETIPLAALNRSGIDVAYSMTGGVAGLDPLSTKCRCGFISPSSEF